MALITGLNQVWWVLGTSVGALAGAHAQLQLTGLEFALTALFAVLAVEQWRASQSAAPLWIALLAYAAAYAAAPQHALVVANLRDVGCTLATWLLDIGVKMAYAKLAQKPLMQPLMTPSSAHQES